MRGHPTSLFLLALLLFSEPSISASQSKQVRMMDGIWGFSVQMTCSVDPQGHASVSVSGFKPTHPGAWISMNVSTVSRAKLFSDRITVLAEIHTVGRSRGFHSSVSDFGSGSGYTWTEPAESDTALKQTDYCIFDFDKYPELAGVQSLTVTDSQETAMNVPAAPSSGSAQDDEEFPHRTYLKSYTGFVQFKRGNGDWVDASSGMELQIGDRIRTLRNGRAEVILAGTAVIKVKPDSEFVIPADKANSDQKVGFIKMVKGFLWARAKKEDDSLKVATPNAICGVRGTEFEISYRDNRSCLQVSEGTVWFSPTGGGNTSTLTAGQTACIPPDTAGGGSGAPSPSTPAFQISGSWKTSSGTMTLHQSGNQVTGEYSHDNGRIEGVLEGRILKGRWSESPSYAPPKDAGALEFEFSEDGNSFKGGWRYGFERGRWNGGWSGTRSR